jgi:hypothetical protein
MAVDVKDVEVMEQINQHITNKEESALMELHMKWPSVIEINDARMT